MFCFTFGALLLFSRVCSDSLCLSVDVKQKQECRARWRAWSVSRSNRQGEVCVCGVGGSCCRAVGVRGSGGLLQGSTGGHCCGFGATGCRRHTCGVCSSHLGSSILLQLLSRAAAAARTEEPASWAASAPAHRSSPGGTASTTSASGESALGRRSSASVGDFYACFSPQGLRLHFSWRVGAEGLLLLSLRLRHSSLLCQHLSQRLR